MRLLITSDWHLSDDPRDAYRFHIIERSIPALLKKHDASALLYLGDVCEAKDEHPAELVNSVVRIFHELSQICPVIAVQGNHDWLSSPDNPFFGFLSRLPDIHWVRSPQPLSKFLGPRAQTGIILPHSANYERDWDNIDFKAYDWAFAHQTFTNATSDSGFRLTGVPLSYFPKKLSIVSGDIHSPQTVGPLTYVGAPYTVDYGDDYEGRVLLLDERGLKSIPVDGPQKRLIEIQSVKDIARSLKSAREGDIVKVRVALSSAEQADWAEIAKIIRQLGDAEGITVQTLQPVFTGKARSMLSSRRELDTRSDEQLLKDYAAARSVDEKTLKTGLKLL